MQGKWYLRKKIRVLIFETKDLWLCSNCVTLLYTDLIIDVHISADWIIYILKRLWNILHDINKYKLAAPLHKLQGWERKCKISETPENEFPHMFDILLCSVCDLIFVRYKLYITYSCQMLAYIYTKLFF